VCPLVKTALVVDVGERLEEQCRRTDRLLLVDAVGCEHDGRSTFKTRFHSTAIIIHIYSAAPRRHSISRQTGPLACDTGPSPTGFRVVSVENREVDPAAPVPTIRDVAAVSECMDLMYLLRHDKIVASRMVVSIGREMILGS